MVKLVAEVSGGRGERGVNVDAGADQRVHQVLFGSRFSHQAIDEGEQGSAGIVGAA